MSEISGRAKLSASRMLGLSDNENDAIVLIDSLINSGIISIEIPEQSMLVEVSGKDFVQRFFEEIHEPR